jgi:hypothetical protein
MAIKIEFVNLIIPIEKINNCKLNGGFNTIIKKHENSIGKTVWFDKHLFRMGWMDAWLIDSEIDFWVDHGLVPLEKINGIEFWRDMFAISTGINQFNSNCDWIKVNSSQTKAWLKGTSRFDVYPKLFKPSYGINGINF